MNKKTIAEALERAFKNAAATHESYGDGWFEAQEEAERTLCGVDGAYSFAEFTREHGDPDSALEEMEYLDEMAECGGDWGKPSWILSLAFYGYRYNPYSRDDGRREAFNPNDAYFYFNGYGNLVSVNELDRFRYWASVVDAERYAEAAEKKGRLDEVAEALGVAGVEGAEEGGE